MNRKKQLLVIDDEENMRLFLKALLEKEGYEVCLAADGQEGLSFLEVNQYDVVVLDILMPRLDGLSLLKKIRSSGNDVHVLVLSAKDLVEDRIKGLDAGADDYLVKPFSFDELVSRLHALNRRRSGIKNPVIEIDGLSIDSVARQVTFANEAITLTPHEYRLLEFLARRGVPLSQGLRQVGDQVVDVFDADGQPYKGVVDAELGALRLRHTGMRHDCRMIDEALDATETFCEREDLAALEETARVGEVTFNEECDDAAEARHLSFRQRMLRVRR